MAKTSCEKIDRTSKRTTPRRRIPAMSGRIFFGEAGSSRRVHSTFGLSEYRLIAIVFFWVSHIFIALQWSPLDSSNPGHIVSGHLHGCDISLEVVPCQHPIMLTGQPSPLSPNTTTTVQIFQRHRKHTRNVQSIQRRSRAS